MKRAAWLSFGLALAGGVMDVEFQSGGDALGLLEKKNVDRVAKAVDKALKLSNVEFDEMVGTMEGMRLLLRETPTVARLKRFLARETAGGSASAFPGATRARSSS